MNILIAAGYHGIVDDIKIQLSESEILAKLTMVETVDDLITELKKDNQDVIITEYSYDGTDAWRLANLVNSTQLSAHALPIYLIKDTCHFDIPPILAKVNHLVLTPLRDLGQAIKVDYEYNCSIGYRRGRRSPPKPSILIIEDDDNAAALLKLNLKGGFNVDLGYSGETGLDMLKNGQYDLVILDYMLPGIKGDEVLDEIMELDSSQHVIVMTAYDNPEMNKNMILGGACEYLPKPFEIAVLKERCHAILERGKLIYQDQYTDSKNETLKNLVWGLEISIAHNEVDKAKRFIDAIKRCIPIEITEDDQIYLTGLEELR
jgi:DNA-binding response OmpR family regulator